MPSRYMTVQEIAAELRISRSAAYELSKKLVRLKVGRIVRVSRASFEAFIAAHEVEPYKQKVLQTTSSARGPKRRPGRTDSEPPIRLTYPRTKPRVRE